jgi:hypothetical protein
MILGPSQSPYEGNLRLPWMTISFGRTKLCLVDLILRNGLWIQVGCLSWSCSYQRSIQWLHQRWKEMQFMIYHFDFDFYVDLLCWFTTSIFAQSGKSSLSHMGTVFQYILDCPCLRCRIISYCQPCPLGIYFVWNWGFCLFRMTWSACSGARVFIFTNTIGFFLWDLL